MCIRDRIYTHHKLYPHNQKLFAQARKDGVVVNVSCESLGNAVSALKAGVNAVCVMPKESDPVTKILDGYHNREVARVVICPAQQKDSVTCASCGLCARDRVKAGVIVGFLAHGAKSKSVEKTIRG